LYSFLSFTLVDTTSLSPHVCTDSTFLSPYARSHHALSGETENLWLNLSTGYIGGGRKNWDGTGGSGAALQHFKDTGSLYPLCVKLGEKERVEEEENKEKNAITEEKVSD
jgi:Zn-finger in ubiquitin-hydrolases and other protein